jgi:signal transduction histidine kinase
MIKSRLIAGMFLLVGIFGTSATVTAQTAPPDTEQTRNVVALVEKAASLIDQKGSEAFAAFRAKNSEWFHDNTYLFVYDLDSNVLLNAAFPAREGTNTTGSTDANGKLFHHDFIQVAKAAGTGWVDYMFPKPGQTEPSQKWAFVKKVTVDGTPGLVASGFYPK